MSSVVMTKQEYKLTDIGLIPEDWQVYKLGEIGEFKNGINKGKDDFGFGYPFVNLLDIFENLALSSTSTLSLINTSSEERRIYNLSRSDVLFVRSSVKPEGVGLTAVVTTDLEDTVYSGFLIRFRDSDKLDLNFKIYCFNEIGFRKRVINSSTVSANTNINQEALKNILIAIPSDIKEQQAIGEVLRDMDELIEKTQALIDKKRNIKTGAIQKLLTNEKWDIVKLDEIAEIKTGNKNTEDKVDNGQYPFFVRSQQVERINTYSYDEEAVLTAGDGVGVGKVFHYVNGKFDVHQRVYKISNFKGIYPKFFFEYFRKNFLIEVVKYTAKSSVDSVRMDMLTNMDIPLPPFPEQQNIANILNDMETEIEKLEQQLDKYKTIKVGMMQELLTGKTRLIKNLSQEERQVIKVDFSDTKQTSNTGHTEQFDDAVVISAITAKFATQQYPLGAFRRQKLTYLFRRTQEQSLKGFEKKAMGPYKSEMKYRGAEGIAVNNGYIKPAQNKTGRGFVAGDNIGKALEYFNKYYGAHSLNSLNQFKYTKNEQLETLATVDFARLELEEKNIAVTLENIKKVIAENEEWQPKLTKSHFADTEIQKALNWSRELFN